MSRKLFGKPIREETTGADYPNQITLESFCKTIRGGVDGFEKNLLKLPQFSKEMYIEEWFETFGAWMEIEAQPDASRLLE